jgi:hypothetical protein
MTQHFTAIHLSVEKSYFERRRRRLPATVEGCEEVLHACPLLTLLLVEEKEAPH